MAVSQAKSFQPVTSTLSTQLIAPMKCKNLTPRPGITLMHKKLYENVEFAFGKGVGSKIYDAMNNATHSIFVISPYISHGYIDFLLRRKREGINISLVTTTEAQKGKMYEIYKKIITQHRITDDTKLKFKNKAKHWSFFTGLVTFLVCLITLSWHGFQKHTYNHAKQLKIFFYSDDILITAAISLIAISIILYYKFHRIKVFSYFYSTNFPFVVVPSIFSDNLKSLTPMLDSFLHAKIYIVDNRNIYIGSANLTSSGIRHNIESFVKVSSGDRAKEIIAEINTYINLNCRAINTGELGNSVYAEPPY